VVKRIEPVEILRPGNGIVFMKVGTHAGETLDNIIKRKTEELENAGLIFWGYGGNTCHPLSVVQPFVKERLSTGHEIRMVMQPMDSKHFAEPALAKEYSEDGVKWKKVPKGIHVRGSRYALVLDSLDKEDLTIDLSAMRVAVGACQGRSAEEYVRGRVDKGCFIVEGTSPLPESHAPPTPIGLVASLAAPYAVLLR
jgi:hypothetical protein